MTGVKKQETNLWCSLSEFEKASNNRPMLIITLLFSGQTWSNIKHALMTKIFAHIYTVCNVCFLLYQSGRDPTQWT